MKVYKRDEDGNLLMHSDTYLGEDYISSNLFHWKYLKKVKSPSGKFRYIYDDSEMKAQEKIHSDVKNQIKGDGYTYTNEHGQTTKHKGDYEYTYGGKKVGYKQSAKDKIAQERYKSYQKYQAQKLKDTPKRIISKGIGFINSLLLNLEKKFIK